MTRTSQWVASFTLFASMTGLGLAQEPVPTPAPASAMPSGKGQKVTVQGCLQSGSGIRASSTGIASPIVPPGTAPATTVETGPVPPVKADPVYVLRASGDSGANRTGMPSATSGQMDERAAAGAQGGTVYRVMAADVTILAAHVGHQVEIEGRVHPASSVAPPTTPSGSSADQAVAGADVLTVGKVRMLAATCQ